MDCVIALQRAFAAHEGERLQVRVGLNAGEPIEEDGDLFGATVIMASRIAAKADAGETLIPEPLRHLLTGKSYGLRRPRRDDAKLEHERLRGKLDQPCFPDQSSSCYAEPEQLCDFEAMAVEIEVH